MRSTVILVLILICSYETLASMMRVLVKQKEQAEKDLEVLRVEKERALDDPASFVEDLMQKVRIYTIILNIHVFIIDAERRSIA